MTASDVVIAWAGHGKTQAAAARRHERAIDMLRGRHVMAVDPELQAVVKADGDTLRCRSLVRATGRAIALEGVHATKDDVQGRKRVEARRFCKPERSADPAMALEDLVS